MKYDEIKNLNELVYSVKAHGLETDAESLCRVQDILGHSTQKELDDVANSVYRNELFFIMFRVWHYVDATRFFNRHNGVDYRYDELKKEYDDLDKENQDYKAEISNLELQLENAEKNLELLDQVERKAKEAEVALESKDLEIMKLKARLYDLMMKEVG